MRLVALSLAITAACGSSGSGGGDDGADASYMDMPGSNAAMRFNPWAIGAKWTYKISKVGKPDALNRVTSVVAYEDVGGPHSGTMAFRIHQELYTETKDVWEVARGDLDVKYKTVFYDVNGTAYETDTVTPYRLKLDESAAHTVTGAQWSEMFSETDVATGTPPATRSETLDWNVVSDAETITVGAGTYTALHVQRMYSLKPAPLEFWYARGVGRLKEINEDVTEELTSFTLAP